MEQQIGRRTETVRTASPHETQQIGVRMAACLRRGDLVLIRGSLGAGKTVFSAGIGSGLQVSSWRGSPTFAIVNEYDSLPRLYHVDLYRLTEPEIVDLGFEEFTRDGIVICEWPERAEAFMRSLAEGRVIDVRMDHEGLMGRRLEITWPADGDDR